MVKEFNIFVVSRDDNLIARLSLLTEQSGYRLCQAATAAAGRQWLSRHAVDVILVDDDAVSGEAYAFCKTVKAVKAFAVIPLVLVAASPKQADAFFALGVNRIFFKPIDEYRILSCLASFLKRRPAAFFSPAASANDNPRKNSVHINRKRIMLGEPDDECLKVMTRLFQREGGEVAAFSKGDQLVSRAATFSPDLIVVDVFLGQTDSAALFIKAVRLLPTCRHIPILAYSYYRVASLGSEDLMQCATAVDSAKKSCLASGATAYLGPFSETSFLQSVDAAVKESGRRQIL